MQWHCLPRHCLYSAITNGIVTLLEAKRVRHLGSDWVGFKNFQFFAAPMHGILLNTVGYNIVFILLNTTLAMTLAILINELYSTRLAKVLQTIYIMPIPVYGG